MYNGPLNLQVDAPGGHGDPRTQRLIRKGRALLGAMEERAQLAPAAAMKAVGQDPEGGRVWARWTPYTKQLSVLVPGDDEEGEESKEEEESTRVQRWVEVHREEEGWTPFYYEAFTPSEQVQREAAVQALLEETAAIYLRIIRITFRVPTGQLVRIETPRSQQPTAPPVDSNAPEPDFIWRGGEFARAPSPVEVPGNAGNDPFDLGQTAQMQFNPLTAGPVEYQVGPRYDALVDFLLAPDATVASPDVVVPDSSTWEEIDRSTETLTIRGVQVERISSLTFQRFVARDIEKPNHVLTLEFNEPTRGQREWLL